MKWLALVLFLQLPAHAEQARELDLATSCHLALAKGEARPANQDFQSLSAGNNSFGFSNKPHWIRLQCDMPDANQEWLVEIGYPLLDDVQVFTGQSLTAKFKLGDHLPYSARPISNRNFLIPIGGSELAQGILLRVESTSAIQIPIRVLSPMGFAAQSAGEYLDFGLYFGIMLALLVYNFFLIGFVKDRAFLHYVGYLLAFGLFQAGLNGLAFQFLWPKSPWFANQALPALIWVSFGFIFAFTRSYLRTRKYAPRLDPALKWIGIACFLVALPCLLFAPYGPAIRTAAAFCLIAVPLMMGTGFLVARRGFSPALYFLTAWAFFLSGIVVLNLKNFGWLPSNFITDYAMQIGSAMEVLLLSLGLGHRFSLLQQAKTARDLEAVKLARDLESERLEKQSAIALADLSKQVAHDIRSPLSALRIATAGLENIALERRNLIALAIDRIVEISNDLLERGRNGTAKKVPVALSGLLNEIVGEARLSQSGLDKKCELNLEVANDAQAMLEPGDFKRALSNILNNAVEACSPGRGQVNIKLGALGDLTWIEIQDNGHGMPKHILDRLGERGLTIGKEGQGSGLGLHHAKKVVQNSNGKIAFESKEGQGTRIRIELPQLQL